MNQILGGHLLKHTEGIKVDVHEPDVEVRVEIRNKATFITAGSIKGLGGFPVGTGGRSLLMLSGGIDSPVAGYLRSEEHTSELQSRGHLVCRLLLEKKKKKYKHI